MTFGTGVKSEFSKAEFIYLFFAAIVLKSRHAVLLAAALSGW